MFRDTFLREVIPDNARDHRLPTKEGKISVSLSLRGCRQCQAAQLELLTLRKQIGRLNRQLQIERTKNKQMDILCDQINKTKDKLLAKFEMRSTPAQHPRMADSRSAVRPQQHAASNKLKFMQSMWYQP